MSATVKWMSPTLFKNTGAREGWNVIFTPESGAMRYLTYARLVFGASTKSHTLETGDKEWIAFCIRPGASVKAKGAMLELGQYDMLYLPKNCTAEISGAAGADLAMAGCPAHVETDVQVVRFNDIKDDPKFFFDVGSDDMSTKRRIHNMIAHNVKASRLLAGFTIGEKTAWTSWPPHEHNTSKEEFYLFLDMPKPAFSVQFVYSEFDKMEFMKVVQDGDCVAIPSGYHPTAAAPGYQSVFLWVMAAFDPEKDRDFKHGITIQPEYQNIKFV